MDSNRVYGILMAVLGVVLVLVMQWRATPRRGVERPMERMAPDRRKPKASPACVRRMVVEEAEELVRGYARVLEPLYSLPDEDSIGT
ncbi:hypothetical protein OG331_48605 [Streptomyces sp. NBC_01017]|uniref:hypothetical protein n=1 Tax=Streptomyces sp. NBC_01017 TaxID=2903721 RepID=UPI00386C3075|nr:hypothetical protein OG331_03370 [Streptomyces sp. NBC_01017]WSV34891.1 hypothetical protein OG331_48605 [Streptomyces sp. NBC_01017]